jgi:ligand-binding sensor domain-containing protein
LPLAVYLTAASAVAQYSSNALTGSNGLPYNTVAAVVQTRDGDLSMMTYDQLVRRGVVRLAIFDKSTGRRRIDLCRAQPSP